MNLFVLHQFFKRVVMTPQLFFRRHKSVNCVVAFTTEIDSLVHLFTRKVLLEPLVAVASAWNQMVFGRAFLGDSTTQFTRIEFRHRDALPALKEQVMIRLHLHLFGFRHATGEFPIDHEQTVGAAFDQSQLIDYSLSGGFFFHLLGHKPLQKNVRGVIGFAASQIF